MRTKKGSSAISSPRPDILTLRQGLPIPVRGLNVLHKELTAFLEIRLVLLVVVFALYALGMA